MWSFDHTPIIVPIDVKKSAIEMKTRIFLEVLWISFHTKYETMINVVPNIESEAVIVARSSFGVRFADRTRVNGSSVPFGMVSKCRFALLIEVG